MTATTAPLRCASSRAGGQGRQRIVAAVNPAAAGQQPAERHNFRGVAAYRRRFLVQQLFGEGVGARRPPPIQRPWLPDWRQPPPASIRRSALRVPTLISRPSASALNCAASAAPPPSPGGTERQQHVGGQRLHHFVGQAVDQRRPLLELIGQARAPGSASGRAIIFLPTGVQEGGRLGGRDFPTLALSRSGNTGISQPSRRAPRVMKINRL